MRRASSFQPFASKGRRAIAAILVAFAVASTLSVGLSIWSTEHSDHQAAVVEIAGRQRTLAERYVKEILLVRAGEQADPLAIAGVLRLSAKALLDGGLAPAVNGNDDDMRLSRQRNPVARGQLEQARRLVNDLTASGSAYLDHRPLSSVRLTAHEELSTSDPLQRLRVLDALVSDVSLNASRTIADADDQNITDLVRLELVLGAGGLLMSLLLAWALIGATRRQTAHFRSVVTASSDLVMVFGAGGCRYVSQSVSRMTGRAEDGLLANAIFDVVHPDDRAIVETVSRNGEPRELVFRVADTSGGWRQLQAFVSDLRHDRQIRGVVFNARDVTERLRLEEQLTRQAFHDNLTDLPNRALFRDRLDHALTRVQRSGESLAVMLIDLDGFKQVNDSLGHDAGDQLLQDVGRRFGSVIRASDTVARLGGDEFAVILEGAGPRQAARTAERLLERLRERVQIAGREIVLGASIGVVINVGGTETGGRLVRDADIAMYAAKDAGRGRYELFEPDMARELGELLGIEQELRLGLDRGEFTLHYQPLIDLSSERVTGVEALARWRSPSRGDMPPARFIPIAETTGLIVELGELVLRQACEQAVRWRSEGAVSDPFITWVNVSAKQLSAGGFYDTVVRILEETGLPAQALGLELTESAIVESGRTGDRARAELEHIHLLGVSIAIDDFGTGFSSLGQLRHFPIDMIKVDRSFVQGAELEGKSATITANLISLAHALNVVAVAEGIESSDQLASVRGFGCDTGQGFLFAQPGPADEVAKLFAKLPLAAAKSTSAVA